VINKYIERNQEIQFKKQHDKEINIKERNGKSGKKTELRKSA
jgi:hypothetical protein